MPHFVRKTAIRIPKSLHEYTQTQVDEGKGGKSIITKTEQARKWHIYTLLLLLLLRKILFLEYFTVKCVPGSVVGIGTGYGLDGSGIESRWG